MAWLLGALFIIPLGGAALSLSSRTRLAEVTTVLSGLACFAVTVAVAVSVRNGSPLEIARHWLRLDSLGAVFLLATSFLYAAGGVFSIGYLRAGSQRRRGFRPFARRYYTYLNLFGWTMLIVPLMNDFATLWVAIELTTIVSVLLVALDRTDAALEAAWKYVVLASVGLGLALLSVIVLYGAGTGELGEGYLPRFERYVAVAPHLPHVPIEFAFLLAVVGFGTKVGFVPLHTWLPDAHSEAPSPVSALLSGALLANAFYAILRFYQVTAAVTGTSFPRHVLLVFGTLSLVLAALLVLRQESYKRLLAYSSVEHIGVIALGIGFGVRIAVFGALFHVVNHAAAKGLAFFGSGSLLRRFDTKEIDGVRGAAGALPFTGPMFLAAALALSGIPVSGIFRSEFQIVSGGLARPEYVWVALLIVFANVAFLGVVWHAGRMVLSPGDPSAPRGETSWWMVAAMAACLVAVIGLGFHLPAELSSLLRSAASQLSAIK
jgi:hydrogenase-4 component F